LQEVKSTNEAQSKRMDYMEIENHRVEDQRSVERLNLNKTLESVYRKIDETELKNEDKIERSMGELADKIDTMANKIDKLEILKYVTFGAWLVVGALLAKFNILGTIFAAMTIGH